MKHRYKKRWKNSGPVKQTHTGLDPFLHHADDFAFALQLSYVDSMPVQMCAHCTRYDFFFCSHGLKYPNSAAPFFGSRRFLVLFLVSSFYCHSWNCYKIHFIYKIFSPFLLNLIFNHFFKKNSEIRASY